MHPKTRGTRSPGWLLTVVRNPTAGVTPGFRVAEFATLAARLRGLGCTVHKGANRWSTRFPALGCQVDRKAPWRAASKPSIPFEPRICVREIRS